MTPFPEQKLQQIIKDIDKALEAGAHPIAAFDADGTLWNTDIGEDFFEYQIKQNILELPDNPVGHYKKLYKENTPNALKWLADINCDQNINDVKKWAGEAVSVRGDLPLFPAQQHIVEHLHKKGVEVFVVTASIKWAVEPAAKYYGIDDDHVIGITTKIVNQKVTKELEGPLTWREGKVTALLEKTQGKKPFFTSGNTEGDLYLLKASSHLRLVHAAAESGSDLYTTEQFMVELAKKEEWHYHSYY